jgi:hypothetical protein
LRNIISVPAQFRGPPNSVNGGYACGVMARLIEGAFTAVLRAPPPLNTATVLVRDADVVRWERESGEVIGEARAADGAVPAPPAAPSLEAAVAAAPGFPGLARPFHPICFCCGDKVEEGVGLRVFAGQVAGAAEGLVAAPWTPNPAFADDDGLIAPEVVWAALDCPGSVSWVVTVGSGGLLGTMTGEMIRRPQAGEPCIVLGWPIERAGRKLVSGTALYSADGELMAKSHQIWIGRAPAAAAA